MSIRLVWLISLFMYMLAKKNYMGSYEVHFLKNQKLWLLSVNNLPIFFQSIGAVHKPNREVQAWRLLRQEFEVMSERER